MADANFLLIQFFRWFSFPATPLRFVSTFRRGACINVKHLCVTFLHFQKVPRKILQNRLTHLCVAVVNRLGNSTSHQLDLDLSIRKIGPTLFIPTPPSMCIYETIFSGIKSTHSGPVPNDGIDICR